MAEQADAVAPGLVPTPQRRRVPALTLQDVEDVQQRLGALSLAKADAAGSAPDFLTGEDLVRPNSPGRVTAIAAEKAKPWRPGAKVIFQWTSAYPGQ